MVNLKTNTVKKIKEIYNVYIKQVFYLKKVDKSPGYAIMSWDEP